MGNTNVGITNKKKVDIHLKLESLEWNPSSELSKPPFMEEFQFIQNATQLKCSINSNIPCGSSPEYFAKVHQCMVTISRLVEEEKQHDSNEEFNWYIQFLTVWCSADLRHTLSQAWISSDHTDFLNKFRSKFHPQSVFKSNISDLLLGYFLNCNTFCTNWPSVRNVTQNCQLDINVDDNLFKMYIGNYDHDSSEWMDHCIDIGCDNIRPEASMDVGSNRLVIGIYRPPLVSLKVQTGTVEESRSWVRCTDIQQGETPSLALGNSSEIAIQFQTVLQMLEFAFVLCKIIKDSFKCRILNISVIPPAKNAIDQCVILCALPKDLNFKVLYAIAVVLSCGSKSHAMIDTKFIGWIQKIVQCPEMVENVVNCLYRLAEVYAIEDRYYIVNPIKYMESNIGWNSNINVLSKVTVRKIKMTPTRVIFEKPDVTESNRIIRLYGPEYMIRVVFVDENCEKKLSMVNNMSHALTQKFFEECVTQRLLQGLRLGNRVYQVLGGSNSQLKEHTLCLYATDQHQKTAEIIRQEIGDFDQIRCVAQYVARVGLAFSLSRKGIRIYPNQIDCIDDVSRGMDKQGNPYCFSDGVGKISKTLVTRLKLPKASAYQIRIGGSKGILVVDPTQPNLVISLRPSMTKFESKHSELEIQSTSKAAPLYLNHQITTLLSQMGVHDSVFYQLQEANIENYLYSFVDNNAALKMLMKYGPQEFKYQALYQSGYQFTRDSFFRRLLTKGLKKMLDEFALKARIPLPRDSARNMMGVLDETGTLHYGEIFVQYSNTSENGSDYFIRNTIILEGTVVVSKMPCLHPGDVRKFTAVNIQGLHHLVDVIVFPQKGKRPHPNEMAGSDLDGDLYFVCWYKPLIFNRNNYEAMEFPSAEKLKKDSKVTGEDMIQFFTHQIMSDKVSIIARAHLKQADAQPEGIFSPVCMELAELHSKAVDAPKTGFIPDLKPEQMPKKSPDFLKQYETSVSYKSKRILGKLYRQAKSYQEYLSEHDSVENIHQDIQHVHITQYMESARKLYVVYQNKVDHIIKRYNLNSEIHMWAGTLLNYSNKEIRWKKEKDLRIERKDMCKEMRWLFLQEFPLKGGHNEEKEGKAIACYYICNDQRSGFPWIFADQIKFSTFENNECLDFQITDQVHKLVKSCKQKKEISVLSYYLQNSTDEKTLHLVKGNQWYAVVIHFVMHSLIVAINPEGKRLENLELVCRKLEEKAIELEYLTTADLQPPKPQNLISSLMAWLQSDSTKDFLSSYEKSMLSNESKLNDTDKEMISVLAFNFYISCSKLSDQSTPLLQPFRKTCLKYATTMALNHRLELSSISNTLKMDNEFKVVKIQTSKAIGISVKQRSLSEKDIDVDMEDKTNGRVLLTVKGPSHLVERLKTYIEEQNA